MSQILGGTIVLLLLVGPAVGLGPLRPLHVGVGSSGVRPAPILPGTSASVQTAGASAPSLSTPRAIHAPAPPFVGPASVPVAFATVNLLANQVVSGVTLPRYANGAGGIAYDATDHLVFVTGVQSYDLEAINPSTGVVQSIGGPLSTANDTAIDGQGAGVTFDAANGRVYMSVPTLDQIDVFQVNSSASPEITELPAIALPPGSQPEGILADAADNRVFVADYASEAVTLIDGANGTVNGSFPILGNPLGLVLDPTQNLVYVTQSGIAQVTWFDPDTLAVSGTGIYGVRNNPYLMALDSSTDTLWVGDARYVTVIDSATRGTSFNITFPAGASLQGLAWSPAMMRMLVANAPAGNVTPYRENGTPDLSIYTGGRPGVGVHDSFLGEMDLVDLASNTLLRVPDLSQTVTARVNLGINPTGATFNPVNDRLEIADNTSNRIVEVDTRAILPGHQPVVRFLTVLGRPAGVAFDPVAGLLVVISNPGMVLGLNASSGAMEILVNLGSSATLYDVLYAGGQVFVSGGTNSVWALNAKTLAVAVPISATSVSSGPRMMAYDPVNQYLYVALSGRKSVGMIDTRSDLFKGEIPVGQPPFGMAYVNSRASVLVSLPYTDNVSVIDVASGAVQHTTHVDHLPGPIVYLPSVDRAFVATSRSDRIDVLEGSTYAVSSMVAVGDHPSGLAFVNITGTLFASNGPDSSLTAIAASPASGSPFAVTGGASPSVTDVGAPVRISVVPSYPAWDFAYRYSALPPGCTSLNTSVLQCTPSTVVANATVVATVTNGAGDAVTRTINFSVVPDPTVASFAPEAAALTRGATTYFDVTVAGGVPPYRYVYTTLPPGCAGSSTAHLSCQPSQVGQYPAEVTVVDVINYPALGSTNLQVNLPPAMATSLSRNSTTLGGSITVSSTVTGGTAPFRFNYSGLPTGCSNVNATTTSCVPSETGTFAIRVTMTDASGFVVKRTVTLEVDPVPSAAAGLPLAVIGAGLGVAVVAILGVLFVLRRRRPATPPEEEEPAPLEPSPIYRGRAAEIPRGEVEDVPARGPVAETSNIEPRYFDPGPEETAPSAPTRRPGTGSAPGNLTCPTCGMVNEPWITNCRRCKRPLQTT
ncbi:MAG: hypothetical protein L3J93_02545 [Thermoplasmata archaeon]|nr:hypothetical protein [Thermoplasmata archaeon]